MQSMAAAEVRSEGVHVVGVGAQTPVGRTAAESAAAIRAALCLFADHPYMADADGEPVRVARATWLPADLPLADRILALVHGAAHEALQPLLTIADGTPRVSVAVVIGTSDTTPGLPARWGQVLRDRSLEWLRSRLPLVQVETCVNGHAAGVLAIQRGCQMLLRGGIDFCLVGGADSHLGPESLLQLEARKQLHGACGNSWGFIPGEAGGFCLLASQESVHRYALTSLLEVLGVAVTREPNTVHSRATCTGAGLSQAVGEVLKSHSTARVHRIFCDQNGEPYRANEFGFTLARYARHFDAPPDFWTPADCWGDVGAASAPLFAMLLAASGERGYAAGEYGLILSSSETEERGAALLRLRSLPAR
jgi:3-oxoacyl-[acyl-carrier-protein] synthase I